VLQQGKLPDGEKIPRLIGNGEHVYQFLIVLTILIIQLCFITILTQAYEYVTIYTILWWQRGKSLGQILHELHEEGIEFFQRLEMCIFAAYVFIFVSSFGLKLYVIGFFIDYNDARGKYHTASYINLGNDLFFAILLSFTFVITIFKLRKSQKFAYSKLKCSFWIFYTTEMIVLFCYITDDFVGIFQREALAYGLKEYDLYFRIMLVVGLAPI
jgi:hypothetical protein